MSDAGNNDETTKMVGGITGKGFMPGVSGNPLGRPKTKPFQNMLLRNLTPDREKELIEALFDKVKKGENWAIEFIADRLDGKELSPPDGSVQIKDSNVQIV